MLTSSELRQLSVPSGWKATLYIFLDWLGIAVIFAVALAFPNPFVYALAFLAIGRQQLALAILMHDGAHRRLYYSARVNDWVGQFLLAAPLIFAMASYKTLHLKHHKDPLASDDPDLSLIGGYPVSRMSFARKLLRDLFGISYFKFIRYFIFMQRRRPVTAEGGTGTSEAVTESYGKRKRKNTGEKVWILFSIFVMNAALFTLLWKIDHPLLYFFLWLLPAVTILQVLLRIRGVAEHAGFQPNKNQMLNARTVINPLQVFLFAPHNVNYHVEHHVYPSVPFYYLPEVHRLMSERYSLPSANMYSGYGQVLAEIIR